MKVLKLLVASIISSIYLSLNGQGPPIYQGISPAIPGVIPVTLCDKQYALEMKNVLDELKSVLNVDLIATAQEYMIMIKQHQDLEYRIRNLELNTFNTDAVSRMRRPLQRYSRCKNALRTNTFTRTHGR